MDPIIKEKWLTALRSGEYNQGRSKLRDGDEFCCLGVLCDLATKEGVGVWEKDEWGGWSFELDAGVLPYSVQRWAGLADNNPPIGPHPEESDEYDFLAAAQANDALQWNFGQIADRIEEYL